MNFGVQLWAYRIAPRYAVAYTAQQNTVTFKEGDVIRQNIELPAEGFLGAKIQWTTSDATAITAKGVYQSPDEEKQVTLTCTITCEDVSYTRVFHVTAKASEDLPEGDYLTDCVAHYPFTSKTTPNQIDKTQKPTFKALGNGTVPTIGRDTQRGNNVLHQYFGDINNASYTVMDNPLKGLSSLKGLTIAMWLKMTADNNWDAIWSFTNKEANDATSRLYMTGNAYVGFNNGSGTWFDLNHPNNGSTNYLPTDQWVFVVMVMNSSSISLYVDGVKKAQKSFAGSAAYSTALSFLRTAPYLQLGTGSFWGSADCFIDDLLIYKRALTAKDVNLLTIMAGRTGTDYTGIGMRSLSPAPSPVRAGSWYDLSGRKVEGRNLPRGIYLVNGRKVVIK